MKKGKIILGVAITLCAVLCLTGCKTKLKNGKEVAIKINGENITADDLYDKLREKYAKYLIVDEIDKAIFNEVYKKDADIEEQVKNQYEYYESQYSQNGESFEDVLKDYGYKNADAFKDTEELSGICFCLLEFLTAVISCLSIHIVANVLNEFCFS